MIGKKRRHCSVSLAPSGMTLYCFFLSWELLDDPSQSSLCGCCQSTCRSRPRRGLTWGIPCSCSFLFVFLHFNKKKKNCFSDSYSFRHKSVLGPLIIVAPSEAPNTVQAVDQVWWCAMIQATGTNLILMLTGDGSLSWDTTRNQWRMLSAPLTYLLASHALT